MLAMSVPQSYPKESKVHGAIPDQVQLVYNYKYICRTCFKKPSSEIIDASAMSRSGRLQEDQKRKVFPKKRTPFRKSGRLHRDEISRWKVTIAPPSKIAAGLCALKRIFIWIDMNGRERGRRRSPAIGLLAIFPVGAINNPMGANPDRAIPKGGKATGAN